MTVKVTLNPGHGMNYNSHERCAEVWTVISGTGRVIVDGVEVHRPNGALVLKMRNTTERTKCVDSGILKLVGISEDVIYNIFMMLLENEVKYTQILKACNSYGDGHAFERIAGILEGNAYQKWMPKKDNMIKRVYLLYFY